MIDNRCIAILLISALLVLYVLCCNNKSNLKTKANICILLTSHITDKNIDMYKSRVIRWIKETPYDIYLVDSGGRGLGFKDVKYREYIFDQTNESYYSVSKKNSSILEKMSVLKALSYFNLDKKYDYIYKITAKYFIPKWEVLMKIPDDIELIIQNRYSRWIQYHNTEIFGIKSNLLESFYINMPHNHPVEWYLYKTKKKYKYYRLPKLKLDMFTKRGNGDTLSYL